MYMSAMRKLEYDMMYEAYMEHKELDRETKMINNLRYTWDNEIMRQGELTSAFSGTWTTDGEVVVYTHSNYDLNYTITFHFDQHKQILITIAYEAIQKIHTLGINLHLKMRFFLIRYKFTEDRLIHEWARELKIQEIFNMQEHIDIYDKNYDTIFKQIGSDIKYLRLHCHVIKLPIGPRITDTQSAEQVSFKQIFQIAYETQKTRKKEIWGREAFKHPDIVMFDDSEMNGRMTGMLLYKSRGHREYFSIVFDMSKWKEATYITITAKSVNIANEPRPHLLPPYRKTITVYSTKHVANMVTLFLDNIMPLLLQKDPIFYPPLELNIVDLINDVLENAEEQDSSLATLLVRLDSLTSIVERQFTKRCEKLSTKCELTLSPDQK